MSELDYKADLDPKECWNLLKSQSNSFLIDCRTKAEWQFVGVPDLSSIEKKVSLIEWQAFPAMNLNQNFLEEVVNSGIKSNDSILIICRSGGRSKSAAEYLTSNGFEHCFNCKYGFEGSHDSNEHRGNLNGWKFSKLPWKQI